MEIFLKTNKKFYFLYRVKELTMHVISFKKIDSEEVLNRIKKRIANNVTAEMMTLLMLFYCLL